MYLNLINFNIFYISVRNLEILSNFFNIQSMIQVLILKLYKDDWNVNMLLIHKTRLKRYLTC